ncbi:MAG: 2-C-methyl-D-erythritol 4-phosphate cytidylyltransferase [Firmicutes bacterium]|nr:2-C-methyl-D-erythritol 4-phosphate cytidylyltransferase [Candidatus Colimorpha enterica]
MTEKIRKLLDKTEFIEKKYNSAIILAGGSGTRATQNGERKQNCLLLGIPVIARTVETFERCSFINEIIIVAHGDDVETYKGYIDRFGWKKVTSVTEGGKTRFESTLNGFKKISDSSQFVYIHDACRCLVTEEEITATGRAACKHGAAVCGHFSVDSVCRYEDKKLKPLDRKEGWISFTPQVFMTELYRAAAYQALGDGFEPTDDVSVALHAGFEVFPVDTGTENIKITYQRDFAVAEAILKRREK